MQTACAGECSLKLIKTGFMKGIFVTAMCCFLALASSAQIKVACIGNSITYGSGIENREVYSYPAQLQVMLGEDWDVQNFGVSGRTMLKQGDNPIWDEPDFANALAFKPDVVIIKLGTNDSKDFNWKYKDAFPGDYQSMIDTLQSVSNPVIFLCQPVPVFGKRWSIDSLVVVDEIVPVVNELGQRNDLTVIDLQSPFMDRKDLFPDLIHPNGHGAAWMAGIIGRYLLLDYNSILQNKLRNERK